MYIEGSAVIQLGWTAPRPSLELEIAMGLAQAWAATQTPWNKQHVTQKRANLPGIGDSNLGNYHHFSVSRPTFYVESFRHQVHQMFDASKVNPGLRNSF